MEENNQTLINQDINDEDIKKILQIGIEGLKNKIFSEILLPEQIAHYTPRSYLFQNPEKYITKKRPEPKKTPVKVKKCYFVYIYPIWDILTLICSLILLISPIIHGYTDTLLRIVSLAIDAGLFLLSAIFLYIILKKLELEKNKIIYITFIIVFCADMYIKLNLFINSDDELLVFLTLMFQYVFLTLVIFSFYFDRYYFEIE